MRRNWPQRNALIPMGRMGGAWDIANAVLFLASDEAGYITATQLGGRRRRDRVAARPRLRHEPSRRAMLGRT